MNARVHDSDRLINKHNYASTTSFVILSGTDHCLFHQACLRPRHALQHRPIRWNLYPSKFSVLGFGGVMSVEVDQLEAFW